MEQVNILVVVDTQVDFWTGSLGTKEAQASVPNIKKKIVECGEAGYIIFTTQDTHTTDYLNTNEGKHLPVPHTTIGTPGWEIVLPVKEVLSKYDVKEVIKYTFGSKELADIIKMTVTNRLKKRISPIGKNLNITLIGWYTDICVIANAILLKTALPEAEITVDSSCCAGVTPETHEAALTVMKSLQINVI